MDCEKLAQLIKLSDRLIIRKVGNGEYLVTDTYFIVRLSNDEFAKFYSYWNTYKSTTDIPFEIEGEGEIVAFKGDKEFKKASGNISLVMHGAPDTEVMISDYLYSQESWDARLVKTSDGLGMFDTKYDFLLELGETYTGKSKLNPIYIIQDGVVQALIMPFRTSENLSKDLRELLS